MITEFQLNDDKSDALGHLTIAVLKGKGKVIPLQARCGPEVG